MTATHVYIDRKPSGEPFYVGVGNSRRVKSFRRNAFHENTTNKYPDWTRTVIETSTWAKCVELEKFLISEIGRRDLGLGSLVNLTDGGDGSPGVICSEEAKLKRSKATKGRPKSDEHKALIGAGNTGKVRPCYEVERMRLRSTGKRMSVESKLKVQAASVKMWSNIDRRTDHAGKMKDLWQNAEYKDRLSKSHQARFTDNPDARNRLSQVNKEIWSDPARRLKQSIKVSDTKWMHKDGQARRVRTSETGVYTLQGWFFGRG